MLINGFIPVEIKYDGKAGYAKGVLWTVTVAMVYTEDETHTRVVLKNNGDYIVKGTLEEITTQLGWVTPSPV